MPREPNLMMRLWRGMIDPPFVREQILYQLDFGPKTIAKHLLPQQNHKKTITKTVANYDRQISRKIHTI